MVPAALAHGLAGDSAGWGDELVLVGILAIFGAFFLWGWWQQRAKAR
jgi:hypothetical protein